MSLDKPSPIPDILDTQRKQLQHVLDEDLSQASAAIGQMPEQNPDTMEIALTDAFSADTVRIIRQIYAEQDAPLIQTLREWVLLNLHCTIEPKDGDIVLAWSDPRVFMPTPKMRDGTGE